MNGNPPFFPGAHQARDFVSFGLDDVLHTAASDSEDFGPALADALPPSGQEARPSAAYSELVDMLSRATEKLALDWPDEPNESRSSTIVSSSLKGGSCHFSAICIERSPVPVSSHFPLALLTRQLLTSPTLWVLWSRVTPPCRWLRILWPHIFHPHWLLLGSPAPSFLPSRVGPLPPLSGSPTSRPVRQVWPFTQWLPGGRPEGNGRRDRLDSWSREGATKSHWLGSESHQAHHTCRGALYGGFGGHRTPSVAQPDRDSGEGKGVFDGRTHLTIWVVRGGC